MTKAVLSNRIYMQYDRELLEKLREDLTYKFLSKSIRQKDEVYRDLVIISSSVLSVPITRIDLIPNNYKIVDNRVYVETKFPLPKFPLRKDQKEIVDKITDSCIINANPGWGKTFTAMHIAYKLGQKTLVVVHTIALLEQWVASVRNIFGIEPGVLGNSRRENLNSPIVIASTQTLVKQVQDFSKMFGTLIMDEVHHLPAKTFKSIADKLKCRYKIGLSATLGRNDGKHVLIYDYISRNTLIAKDNNELIPKIAILNTGIEIPGSFRDPWANRITKLYSDNPKILELVIQCSTELAEAGHKVLAPFDRVDNIEICHSITPNSLMIDGRVKNRREIFDLLMSKDYSILYGTLSIFSEGLSENYLSAIVHSTPSNNVHFLKQLIGRITRPYPNKLDPVLIDFAYSGTTGEKQLSTRMSYYSSRKYDIIQL